MYKLFSLLAFMPILVFGQVKLDSLLMGCYSFNGNASDSSGNGNHGIVFGATLTTDRFNKNNSAYEFDRIDDYIAISDFSKLNPNDELTISLWAQSYSGGKCLFMLSPDDTNQCVGCAQYQNQWFYWDYGDRNSGGSYGVKTSASGAWHHYVFTYSLSYQYKAIYQDTVLMGDQSTGLVLNNKTRDLLIGAGSDRSGGNIRWGGKIDDIHIYARALNLEEISALYKKNFKCESSISNSINQTYAEQTNYLKIYPNPASREIKIENSFNQSVSISISDIQGREMLEIEVLSKNSTLSVESWPAGVYFVKYSINDQSAFQKIQIIH